MKKKLIISVSLLFTILLNAFPVSVKAFQYEPEFLITNEYVIIEYEKYDLVDNKINYNNRVYELIDDNFFVSYDCDGTKNILTLPLENNKIKDKTRIKQLNDLVGINPNSQRAIPSTTVNPPYTKTLANDQWIETSPAVNVNMPGKPFYKVLSLKITGLAWNASKIFDVYGIYGDSAGNWYDLPSLKNHNFGSNNIVKWNNFSSTRYAILTFGNISGETGYTYTINRSTI